MNAPPAAHLPRFWLSLGALGLAPLLASWPWPAARFSLLAVSAAVFSLALCGLGRERRLARRHAEDLLALHLKGAQERSHLQRLAAERLDQLALDGMAQLGELGVLREEIAALKEKIRSLEQRSRLEHQILLLAAREPPIDDPTLMREFKLHEVAARQCLNDLVRALLLQPYPQPRGGFQLSPKGRNYLRDRGLLREESPT